MVASLAESWTWLFSVVMVIMDDANNHVMYKMLYISVCVHMGRVGNHLSARGWWCPFCHPVFSPGCGTHPEVHRVAVCLRKTPQMGETSLSGGRGQRGVGNSG